MENSSTEEGEKCRLAVDVAMKTAVGKCGSREAVRRQVMDLFGFSPDETCPDCECVLEDGITDEVEGSVLKQREYAMCRAWQLVDEEGKSFREASNIAWSEVREGDDTPEV